MVFLSIIYSPTRNSQETKFCIEHIFIRSRNIVESAIFNLGINDHFALSFNLKGEPLRRQQ